MIIEITCGERDACFPACGKQMQPIHDRERELAKVSGEEGNSGGRI